MRHVHQKKHKIIELPVRKPPTGDLGAEKYTLGVTCPRCRTPYCSCGNCHTPGCRYARVICEEAQEALMYREGLPEDVPPPEPPKRKRWFW